MNNIHTPPREKKLGRYLGLSYITAGAFFLFEPYIGIIDLLPDCLGYLFLFLGFYRLADMDDRLMDGLKGAWKLALVGIARIVAMFLSFGFVSPTEQPVFMLLALFTLAVLDCIVLVPMWKNICGGLLYLGSREDATAMLDRRGAFGKTRVYNITERYTAVTTIFFILHEALAVLPELTVLSHEKGGADLGNGTQYYDFVGLFRLTGMTVSLVLGIVWLTLTIRFIHRIKGDKPFFERLTAKYRAEVLPRHDMWAMRAVRASLVCLTVAAVLSLDFYLDGINIIPDTLAAVLMLLSVIFIRHYAGKNIPAQAATVAFGISAAVSWWMQKNYFGMNQMEDIFRVDELTARWQVTVLLHFVTVSLFLLAMGLILKNLFRMVKKYTGLHAFREGSTYAAERSEAIHKLIRRKIVWVMVCAGLVALSTLFQWGVVPQMAEVDLFVTNPSSVNAVSTMINAAYQMLTEGYWFIDLCFGAALIGTIISATNEISEQMEYSYMMKD